MVEVGTGAGISGLHLLAGMAPDGILTTIDVEAEHQRAAKKAFAEAGIAPTRTRLINGRALDVLPRLTDGAYDLVFVDGARTSTPSTSPRRLGCCDRAGSWSWTARWPATGSPTRPSGTARRSRFARPAAWSATTKRSDRRAVPLGDGLLAAVKRA